MDDCDALRAHKAAASTEPGRLALGRCLLPVDPKAAEAALRTISDAALLPYARRLRAEVALARHRPDEALGHLDGLTLPADAGFAVRLLRAEALLAAGRAAEADADLSALTALRGSRNASVVEQARVLRAQAAEASGVDAVGRWTEVWVRSVRGDGHTLAQQALTRLGALPTDRTSTLARIAVLRDAGLAADAWALLTAAHGEDWLSDGERRELALQGRDYATALQLAEARLTTTAGDAGARYDAAVAASRTAQHDRAIGHYRLFLRDFPGHRLADEASYKIALLELDRGACEAAIVAFDEHLARIPGTGWAESSAWFAARCAWRLGQQDDATRRLETLVREHPDSSLAPGAAYWQARHAGTDDALAAMRARWPRTGWAWLAATRLGEAEAAAPPPPDAPLPASLATLPDGHAAEALLAAGFRAEAQHHLAALRDEAKAQGVVVALAHTMVRAGDADGGRRLVSCPTVPPPSLREVCLPRPHAEIVGPIAASYGLSPWLPYAIMQAESLMDPSATSPVGARGLMQIMPAEGARMHAAARLPGVFTAEALYDSAYNARLGTTELGERLRSLRDVLNGDPLPAVIASYNAGETAVRRWTADGAPEVDAFVEDVPYTETRGYVRRVLGYLMAYRQAYGVSD